MIKKFKFIITFLFFLIINHNYTYADSSIYFIDLDFIYNNSEAGKKINDEIKSKSKKINTQLSTIKKKIDDDKKKLINQKNILSVEEYENKTNELKKRINEYNKLLSSKKKELIVFRDKSKIEFSNKLKDILQDYAKNNSIEMIINKSNILIGKNNLDVTKDILNLFNKNVKLIKIQ